MKSVKMSLITFFFRWIRILIKFQAFFGSLPCSQLRSLSTFCLNQDQCQAHKDQKPTLNLIYLTTLHVHLLLTHSVNVISWYCKNNPELYQTPGLNQIRTVFKWYYMSKKQLPVLYSIQLLYKWVTTPVSHLGRIWIPTRFPF